MNIQPGGVGGSLREVQGHEPHRAIPDQFQSRATGTGAKSGSQDMFQLGEGAMSRVS